MAVRKCNPYREAQRADAAYESELRKCYGSKSSAARYSAFVIGGVVGLGLLFVLSGGKKRR